MGDMGDILDVAVASAAEWMGQASSITVPAEHASLFRENALHTLESRTDSLEIAVRRYCEGKESREELLGDRDEFHQVERLVDQIDWQPVHEGDEPLTVTAPRMWVRLVLQGALIDAGDQVHETTENAPLDAARLARAIAHVQWFAEELGEEPVVVLRPGKEVAA